jgi:peptidoglycan/LPS O-acetylase OafA/YrhL
MTQRSKRNFRYPQLDGLRGIAILMVVEYHYHLLSSLLDWASGRLSDYVGPLLTLGWTGVDLFFVLSGFLIGGILLDNKQASNYFGVFYTRRVCRIFPLYFLVAILFLLVIPVPRGYVLGMLDHEPLPLWTYFTYTQNIAMAQEGSYGYAWLTPTWSLAVEEQFYLILPFLIAFVPRSRLPYLLVGLFLLALPSRLTLLAFYPHPAFAVAYLLPSRGGESLFLGVLCALAVRNDSCRAFLRAHVKTLYGTIGVLATGVLILGPYSFRSGTPATYFPSSYGLTLIALLYTCVLLAAVTEKRGLISLLTRNQLLGKVGVISYGIYLLHLPVQGLLFWFLPGAEPTGSRVHFLITLVALLLTVALASVSWVYFEKRIVDWGHSFKYKASMRRSS